MFIAVGVVVASIDESSVVINQTIAVMRQSCIITVKRKREDREMYRYYHYLCLFFPRLYVGRLNFLEKKADYGGRG